ncbi:helix-turn-helix transcriptional regulator [Streptomyces acidiscabies]|uniref:helix-turn-helix transcriptional regulator n=1 Tax=Streptomyces acidiscabies TaxID=42234 RepID=UPI00095321CC|nr:AlpA family phage regulatory protein [Streptomyces acidiscabies]
MDIVQKFGKDVAVPKSPESEGSRLITLKEIEQEHGVSRSALHTYRRSASFPRPVSVEGSTKIQYRADEVAAWFEANPPSQGKRTDLAPRDEGADMWSTNEQPTPSIHLSPEEQERLQATIEKGAVRAALAVGLPEEQSRRVGAAAVEGVRGLLSEARQT